MQTRTVQWLVTAVLVLVPGPSAAQTAAAPARPDAAARLRADAERAFTAGPFSVMQKTRVAPSGDKHDFLSIAPYWWPDPDKAGGLPYIRRDGEVNPESRVGTDDGPFGRMVDALRVLAGAYRAFGEERFAARAALLLRTWFLDPATRMHPHLDYGQAVPGRNQGRGAGIIATRRLAWVVEASRHLAGSPAWTDADRRGLHDWCAAYARWLQTSANGKDEAAAANNHGTWYEVQLVALQLHIGQQQEARARVETRVKERLAAQIEPDGRQPHELARTRAWSYSVMNLEGWFAIAQLGREVGVNLWNYRTPDGRSLRGALDYLVPFAAGQATWTHRQITPYDPAALAPLLRQAAVEWRDPAYAALADRLEAAGPKPPHQGEASAAAGPQPCSAARWGISPAAA
jgi:hypothetical protein